MYRHIRCSAGICIIMNLVTCKWYMCVNVNVNMIFSAFLICIHFCFLCISSNTWIWSTSPINKTTHAYAMQLQIIDISYIHFTTTVCPWIQNLTWLNYTYKTVITVQHKPVTLYLCMCAWHLICLGILYSNQLYQVHVQCIWTFTEQVIIFIAFRFCCSPVYT